ncbi:MAG: SufE family protein [Verrucomicrobiota bacterium]
MSPRERQNELIARYAILPDAHERLAALMARRSKLPALPPEERTPEALVPGCISRVWLVPSLEKERCRFRIHAESALVKGLATALCELYDDATPEEITATPPEFLEALGIAANLSPTRLGGLSNLHARIAAFAQSCLSKP